MSAPTAARLLRFAGRNAARSIAKGRQTGQVQVQAQVGRAGIVQFSIRSSRCFSLSARSCAGLMPESENPPPPNRVEEQRVQMATEIDDDEYTARADEYMDGISEKAEALQESREDMEVEYSAGVLSITLPPAGTYIINKQPHNKQIWLSSPTSGPKRYDWVVDGESMHQKEGSGEGDWVYLRDGSSLTTLLRRELGIDVDLHGHEERMAQTSVDPTE